MIPLNGQELTGRKPPYLHFQMPHVTLKTHFLGVPPWFQRIFFPPKIYGKFSSSGSYIMCWCLNTTTQKTGWFLHRQHTDVSWNRGTLNQFSSSTNLVKQKPYTYGDGLNLLHHIRAVWTSIHPAILMWTKGHQGFDPYPNKNQTASNSCGWLQCPWYPPKSPLNLVSVDG